MKNIFKDAYFGKMYKTRDGRKALFIRKYEDNFDLETEDCYNPVRHDGSFLFSKEGYESNNDIVSEWQEEINGEQIMDKYTLYCTGGQTKKALKLDAPIMDYSMFLYDRDNEPKMIYKNEWNIDCYCHLPTTDQMIGWLEEKGVVITISNFHNEYGYTVSKFENNFDEDIAYHSAILSNKSRKEATLAAIDAALEYLTNKKTNKI